MPIQKISILGLGNWGTALAQHLATQGHEVLGWSIDEALVIGINAHSKNPRYQSGAELHKNFRATTKLDDCFACPICVCALPSSALSEVLPKLRFSEKESIFVSVVKGILPSERLTPLQYAAKILPADTQLAVLSGPSFASDLAVGRPIGIVAASQKLEVAQKVSEIFTGKMFRVYTSTDTLGVELGGILKNVIALAAGVCDGLQFGDSARAGLITRGLAEMIRLAEAMGAQRMTLFGLAGLGDLMMTASCDQSRNRTTGLRLGRGEELSKILADLGSVAEGVKTASLVQSLAKEFSVDMPISEQVALLVEGKVTAQEMSKNLMARPVGVEF